MQKAVNIFLTLAILGVAGWIIIKPGSQAPKPAETDQTKESPMPQASSKSVPKPEMMVSAKKKYTVTLHTTEGDIVIDLDAKNVPITANNFFYLAKEGFYDNVIFHRVIPGFMIQGGDPTGTGTGGPGYKFDDEKFTGKYTRGTVAMANAGPNTNGSQFFIMHADYDLPPNYVIFGHVVKGLDVVDKIATTPTVQDGRENSKPVNPITIKSADTSEK